jgi:hypothetical protein
MMKHALFLVLGAAVLLIAGCADECPICPDCREPEPCSNEVYDGRLYVAMVFGTTGIFVVDTKTETVLDSVLFGTSADDIRVSSNGRYLATSDAQTGLRVWDAKTMEVIAQFPERCCPQFINDDQYMLCHRHGLYLYSLPDFELVHQDTFRMIHEVRYSQARNSLFTVRAYRYLYEYSLDSFKVVREWWPEDANGDGYALRRFDMSEDDRLLYMLVIARHGSAYITYDLEADSLISESPLYGYVGRVCANPFTGDVYVTDPGGVMPSFTPGTIYIFDGETGEYKEGISLYGYFADSWDAMSAWRMALTPDGSQLYVATGHINRDFGTVLRVDTRTQRIENLIFPKIDRFPSELAVGPKPE